MNLKGSVGSFSRIASHKRQTASVTSLRGLPYIPRKVRLCPKQETTVRHPRTRVIMSVLLISRMLFSITDKLAWPFTVSGRLSSDRTTILTAWPQLSSSSTSRRPVAPLAPTMRIVIFVPVLLVLAIVCVSRVFFYLCELTNFYVLICIYAWIGDRLSLIGIKRGRFW